jgi:hypothetical protein
VLELEPFERKASTTRDEAARDSANEIRLSSPSGLLKQHAGCRGTSLRMRL